jgi:hypothetical protein
MPLDYSALLYDPVYAGIGVPATFAAGSLQVALTVIDDTRPIQTPTASGVEARSIGHVEVRALGPGAFVRIPELQANGVSRADWQDAVLSFNGGTWQVRSYELRGSPNGEDFGEVRFLLREASVG